MALFTNVVSRSQEVFPGLIVKYKDQSILMLILSKIAFFNKDFMTYTTTLGSTIYLSSAARVKISPVSNSIVFLHEISHIFERQKKGGFVFSLLYLFPQILALLSLPVLILFGWKLALLCLLFLAPIPAYFRMQEEMQAYVMSLYVMNKLNQLYSFNIDLDDHKNTFVAEFSSSNYYYMWPFPSIEKEFVAALEEIKLGGKPKYNPVLYGIIDNILAS